MSQPAESSIAVVPSSAPAPVIPADPPASVAPPPAVTSLAVVPPAVVPPAPPAAVPPAAQGSSSVAASRTAQPSVQSSRPSNVNNANAQTTTRGFDPNTWVYRPQSSAYTERKSVLYAITGFFGLFL
jgi:hypothetical protein